MKKVKISMVGLGSIGRRHLANVADILSERDGLYSIDVFRSGKSQDFPDPISKFVNRVYYKIDDAPDDYDVVFITNPTHLHYETIRQFVGKTKHMFIEKPAFDKTDVNLSSLGLQEDCIYYVACPLRYTNVIQYLKNNVDLTKVFCVRVICSSYLPDWRPDQDYRQTYSAHRDQGGGVSIDLIHEWDYLSYLFGFPNKVFTIQGRFSNLEIDSDDLSIYIAKFGSMAAEVHLDYFGREAIREIQLFTANDTITGDLIRSEIRFLKSGEVISFSEQRNDYQRQEIIHFFDIIEGQASNENSLSTALRTLQIARGEL